MTDTDFEARAGSSGHDAALLDVDAALLDVSVRSEGPSAWVIEVRGELDLFTGPMLKQHLEHYKDLSWNGGHPRRIAYLLPGLEFMDASGLGALLGAVDGYGPATITIREPSPPVRRLLELVGMDPMIEERANR